MGKIQRKFKEDLEKGKIFSDGVEVFKILHNIYNDYLKETRHEVCRFFKINNSEELSLKVILRLYYFYLPINNYSRIMMDFINFQLNYILDRISIGYVFPLFLMDEDHLNFKQPSDV